LPALGQELSQTKTPLPQSCGASPLAQRALHELSGTLAQRTSQSPWQYTSHVLSRSQRTQLPEPTSAMHSETSWHVTEQSAPHSTLHWFTLLQV